MKSIFYKRTLIAIAVAAFTAATAVGQAQEQSGPTPADTDVLPPNIDPASPVAQVIKLAQSGVDVAILRSFVANTTGAFNLDADTVVYLKDVGVPTDIINLMMDHDKNMPAPIAATPTPSVTVAESAPPPPVTVNYFYNTLTPYGSWVDVEGYGRCWRPTAVIYDSTWQPYCDRGHWVYSDYGWYWDSDYSWGVTFHYGRWFRHPSFGWCWWPDTVWGPSWVTWRSGSDYCGWAPLPPFTVYQPGIGFYYHGVSVGIGFDFGLAANYYVFVPPNRLCDHRPRYYRAGGDRVTQIYRQTTVINNYRDHNRTFVNGGISVDRINTGGRRPIQTVAVSQIPNAGRQGWRGNDSSSNGQVRHGPVIGTGQNNSSHQGQPSTQSGRGIHPQQPQTPTQPDGRTGSRIDSNRNSPPSNSRQNVNPPASRTPSPVTPADRNQRRTDQSANPGNRNSQAVNNGSPIRNQPVQTPPVIGAPANIHPAPSTAGSGRNLNPALSAPASRDLPRNYNSGVISGGTASRFNAPATASPPIRPQVQLPASFNSPRNSPSEGWQQRSVPRNVTPPPAPVPRPAPAPSAPRNSGGSNRDKQNH